MTAQGEVWRGVPGLEDSYQVSSLGRVRSLDRRVEHPRGARRRKGIVLKPRPTARRGAVHYLGVNLCHRGQRFYPMIHQLVAWAFLGDPPPGAHVHHVNGDTTDNRAANLAYVPRAAHGSLHSRGERNPRALLTEDDVRTIRRALGDGRRPAELAAAYAVTRATVYSIAEGYNWKHVQPLEVTQ